MEGIKESQLYYTTPQTKKQAGNAGNAKENTGFPADFLPGACRTGGDDILFRRCESLKMFKAGLDFSRNRC